MTTNDLPAPGSFAASVDLMARLRVFDSDGSLTGASREVWAALAPEITHVSRAFWEQWLQCFSDERI